MDVSADLLTGLGRSKYPDNRDPGLFSQLGWPDVISERRIVFRGGCLVVVDAVQPHSENVHGDSHAHMVARGVSPERTEQNPKPCCHMSSIIKTHLFN